MIEAYGTNLTIPAHLLSGADDNSRERKSQAFHLLQIPPHTHAKHTHGYTHTHTHAHSMYTQTYLSQ